jgi:hypothetical protein
MHPFPQKLKLLYGSSMKRNKRYSITLPEQVFTMLKAGAALHGVTIGQMLNGLIVWQSSQIMQPGTGDLSRWLDQIVLNDCGRLEKPGMKLETKADE